MVEKELIYVGNGGIKGFEEGLRITMFNRIEQKAKQDGNDDNRLRYALEVMSSDTLKGFLLGYSKAEQKTIVNSFRIAKKKILKQEVKYILDEKVAIGLNVHGWQIDEILSNMKNPSYLEETFGEISEEDKIIIGKCINEYMKDIEARIAKGEKFEPDIEFDEDNEEKQDESNSEPDVMPIRKDETSKERAEKSKTQKDKIIERALNEVVIKPYRRGSIERETYYQEVLRFTNGFSFFCEDSMIYESVTGYREKFKNFDNYKKFYALREKVQRIINEKHVSEGIAMALLLNDPNIKLDSQDREILVDAYEKIITVKPMNEELETESERK